MDINNFRVCVECITYNHANYICQSMDGFCLQETDFPFVCAIVDDCSRDGAFDIIYEYVHTFFSVSEILENDDYRMIFAHHKKNLNCYFAVYLLKYNHYQVRKPVLQYIEEWERKTDYIALCEGDDFWTNRNKLQRQVSFLDANPDYSMCFGDVVFHHVDGSHKDVHCNKYHNKANKALNRSKARSFNSIICGICRIQTLSAVVRAKDYLNRDTDPYRFMMGDTQIWLDMSQLGKIGYLEECLGVYNIHKGSATNNSATRRRFTLSAKEMCVFYCKKYGYRIPFQKKVEYNIAYFDLLFHQGCINPPALFEPFPYSFVQRRMASKMKTMRVTKCMRGILLIEKRLYSLYIMIRSLLWQVSNKL